MKVKDLIKLLEKEDPEAPVMKSSCKRVADVERLRIGERSQTKDKVVLCGKFS